MTNQLLKFLWPLDGFTPLDRQASMGKPLPQQSGKRWGKGGVNVNPLHGAQCCGPLKCEKLLFPSEACRFMLPGLLSSMSKSLYFSINN